jgi:hypothetical protein
VNSAEHDRISEMGRRRGAELAATGLLIRKASALKTLGWPEAVRRVREAKAS